jgi:hypothetical protein
MTSLPITTSERSCGKCTACCTALQVTEIEKPDYVRCTHLRTGSVTGCGIYPSRPDSCRSWKCLWLRGVGEKQERPDKLGIVLDVEECPALDCFFVKVFPLRKDALADPKVDSLIQRVTMVGPPAVAVVYGPNGSRTLLGGEPEAVKRVLAYLNETEQKK